MSDDIVKRLRGDPAPGDHVSKLIAEAANEILRLRARADHLMDEARMLETEKGRLRVVVRDALPFIQDAGNDEDPEAKARACEWLVEARRALEGGK